LDTPPNEGHEIGTIIACQFSRDITTQNPNKIKHLKIFRAFLESLVVTCYLRSIEGQAQSRPNGHMFRENNT